MLHVQGVAEGLSNGSTAEIGKFTAFFAGGGGQFDVASGVGDVGVTNKNEAYTLGGTVRTSDTVTLGAAFGQTRTNATFGMGGGDFKTRDYSYSVFGAMKMGGFYADGVATIANTKYSDVHRNITLGSLNRQATSSTSGSTASVFLNAGYDFHLRNFAIGPVVSATWQNVGVSAFDEAGAGSSNLHIGDQTRNSQVWSGGIRASVDWAGFTPWIRFTADKEQENDPRYVTAMPLSLAATGNSYDVLAYAGDTSYTTFQAGVRTMLAPNVGVGVSYYKVSGRSGTNEWSASAALTYKF
jgi:outer membrane lipase/esterase